MNIRCRFGMHKRLRHITIDGTHGPWQTLSQDKTTALCWRCRKPLGKPVLYERPRP